MISSLNVFFLLKLVDICLKKNNNKILATKSLKQKRKNEKSHSSPCYQWNADIFTISPLISHTFSTIHLFIKKKI